MNVRLVDYKCYVVEYISFSTQSAIDQEYENNSIKGNEEHYSEVENKSVISQQLQQEEEEAEEEESTDSEGVSAENNDSSSQNSMPIQLHYKHQQQQQNQQQLQQKEQKKELEIIDIGDDERDPNSDDGFLTNIITNDMKMEAWNRIGGQIYKLSGSNPRVGELLEELFRYQNGKLKTARVRVPQWVYDATVNRPVITGFDHWEGMELFTYVNLQKTNHHVMDLHYQKIENIHHVLNQIIKMSKMQKLRMIWIVTGRGTNKKLFKAVKEYLKINQIPYMIGIDKNQEQTSGCFWIKLEADG